MRKGQKVMYVGNNELGKGRIFTVEKKSYNMILVYFPLRYLDGSIHDCSVYMPISDFVRV